ncbi:hypothetical protein JHK82_052035 [Glycine max]|nr:hypothetical protein JHK84_051915 [Glycine max]KAG5084638.1 hypothetical protein JHK82_052035 [Glycine max]
MMVSISKVTLVLYVLIMVLLGLQMKGTESEVLPSKPNLFKDVTLYFCLFVWYGAVRYFDIYRQDRDHCFGSRCYWEIFEIGPCKINPRSTECFIWNP